MKRTVIHFGACEALALPCVCIMRSVNPRFTYLLTYLQQFIGIFVLSCALRNITVIGIFVNGKCLRQLVSFSVSVHAGRWLFRFRPQLDTTVSASVLNERISCQFTQPQQYDSNILPVCNDHKHTIIHSNFIQ